MNTTLLNPSSCPTWCATAQPLPHAHEGRARLYVNESDEGPESAMDVRTVDLIGRRYVHLRSWQVLDDTGSAAETSHTLTPAEARTIAGYLTACADEAEGLTAPRLHAVPSIEVGE